MIGRVAAAVISYMLCIFYFRDSIEAIGAVMHLSGFWALFVPAALVGFSVYRLADLEDWGAWDALALLILGSFALLSLTNDPGATIYEIVKGTVSFSIAAILAGLTLRKGGAKNGH